MENTYTFSRALHMMRYGGAKMKPLSEEDGYYLYVENYKLTGGSDHIGSVTLDEDNMPSWITPKDIMGSWVEVQG